MNLNLKIPTTPAIELVDSSNQEEYNLNLLGVQALAEKNTAIEANLNNNQLCCEKNSFKNVFNETDTFFYAVELFSAFTGLKLREVGIGKYRDNTIYRITPMYTVNSEGQVGQCANGLNLFYTNDPAEYVYVSTYMPKSYHELLIQENSLIVSSDKQLIPKVIYIEENSTIGRIGADIESISFSSISSLVFDYIKSYAKQLVLKCSRLDVKKVKTSNIIIDATPSGDEKGGSIFFDSKSKELKFFNGSKWKKLLTEDAE